ncbi:ribosome-associated translation inhibitor RaiA [Rickettsiales bacterium]|nr:ribosome-associated translation inhibitor RaiA [Rickettsiales bacterium]
MQIRTIGANMEIGNSLTDHVRENLEKEVTKYFSEAIDAQVNFSKEVSDFKVVILINGGVKGGIRVKSDGNAGDAYSAFNEAKEKAAKQLRRYKRKLKNHHKNNDKKEVDFLNSIYESPKYVITEQIEDEILNDAQPQELIANENKKNFDIITEKTTDIETLFVDDAIMKMNLADLPALAFVNEETKDINVVYHRKDGNISLIDLKTGY